MLIQHEVAVENIELVKESTEGTVLAIATAEITRPESRLGSFASVLSTLSEHRELLITAAMVAASARRRT